MSAPQLDDYPELADAVIEAKAQALLYAFSAWRGEADEQRPTPVEVLAEQFLGYEIVIPMRDCLPIRIISAVLCLKINQSL